MILIREHAHTHIHTREYSFGSVVSVYKVSRDVLMTAIIPCKMYQFIKLFACYIQNTYKTT